MMMSAARRFGARGSGRNGERAGLLGATGAGSSLGDDLESPSSSSASAAVTCAFAASLSALCFGYHMAAINGCLEAIAGANNLVAQGLVVSTLLVGAAVGSFFAGRVADAFGRRRGLQYTGLLLVLGPSICVALSSSLALILAGRFVTGLGVGLASSLCPLYISETAPKHLRGSLGSVNQLTICAGIVFGLASNLVYADWRPIFVWGAVPAGILVALAEWVLPESPRHLAATGRREEARKVALGLWGDSIEAREEASGVVAEAAMADKEAAGSLSAAPEDASILHPKYRKILAASVLMFVFQQMSGINSIVFFSSSIFHAIGVPSAALASLIVGMVNFFGTLLTCFLVERLGRKQMMQVSYGAMGASLVVLAVCTAAGRSSGSATLVIVASIVAYVLSFAFGAGAIPGVYVNEIAPSAVRGQASSAAFTTHWVMNILIGQTFLSLAQKLGLPAMYACFAVWCFGALVFVSTQVVETKGRSLAQISADFLVQV